MKLSLFAAAALAVIGCTSAQAAIVKPGDVAVPVSPAFGAVAPGGLVTNQYNGLGVNFSTPVAIFSDPPLAWSGVNSSNIVDILSPVGGFFTLPGTGTLATTGFLSVEAGNAGVGNLLLEAFDLGGILLGSTVNDDGLGPAGRTLLTLTLPGIHSFRVTTPVRDLFGVNQIEFGTLVGRGTIPEPSTIALMLAALALASATRQRRGR